MTRRCAMRCDAWPRNCATTMLVFLMGEEVAEYGSAYKDQPRPAGGIRRAPRDRHTHHRAWLYRSRHWRGVSTGLGPIVEFADLELRHAGDGRDPCSAAKTRYMSGGQMKLPIVFRRSQWRGDRVAAQHSQDYAAWYASMPGMKVIARLFCPPTPKDLLKAAIRDPNPVMLPGKRNRVRDAVVDFPKLDDLRPADRQGAHVPPGLRRHHRGIS